MKKGPKYIIKNITRRDINIGDLRLKIPAGQARNLLGKKSRVTADDILMSETNGSLKKFLGRSLIKLQELKPVLAPLKEIERDPSAVSFPRRRQSLIIIEVGDIDEEIKDLILSEDEEYLKQLELESKIAEGGSTVPVVAQEEGKDE